MASDFATKADQEAPSLGERAARFAVIASMAFLTLVDLFATQAILPTLAVRYAASPAQAGLAVNATTLGMAISSLGVAVFSSRLDRRVGVVVSLCLLAIPTALLAFSPNLAVFGALRIVQGLCMATAFALTLAYLGEHVSAKDSASAFAAYIAGNVGSNLFGRLLAALFVDHLGLSGAFLAFAVLNLAGAALAARSLERAAPMARVDASGASTLAIWRRHLTTPGLLPAFAVGFCILFAFVGEFSYVNFVLAAPPLSLGMMSLGLVYLVFAPSLATTPLGGALAARWGARGAAIGALLLAFAGALLTLSSALSVVLLGLTLVGVGTFLAQAVTTGFVGGAARGDRGAASGLYLAFYFAGGLCGGAILGVVYQMAGWRGCTLGVAGALLAAAALASRFTVKEGR